MSERNEPTKVSVRDFASVEPGTWPHTYDVVVWNVHGQPGVVFTDSNKQACDDAAHTIRAALRTYEGWTS